MITIRTVTNLFTFLVLVAAAVVIFYSTQFGLENVSQLTSVVDNACITFSNGFIELGSSDVGLVRVVDGTI